MKQAPVPLNMHAQLTGWIHTGAHELNKNGTVVRFIAVCQYNEAILYLNGVSHSQPPVLQAFRKNKARRPTGCPKFAIVVLQHFFCKKSFSEINYCRRTKRHVSSSLIRSDDPGSPCSISSPSQTASGRQPDLLDPTVKPPGCRENGENWAFMKTKSERGSAGPHPCPGLVEGIKGCFHFSVRLLCFLECVCWYL